MKDNLMKYRALILSIFAVSASAAMNLNANAETREYLEVNPTFLKANSRVNTFHVEVKASGSWTAVPVTNADGSSFLGVSVDGNELDIRCSANNECSSRTQKILVKMDGISREIKVRQAGLGIEFYTDPETVTFKVDGGKKKVKVYCNNTSDEGEVGNWSVLSCPDWIDMVIDKSKVKVNDKNNIIQPMKSLEVLLICKGLVSPSALAHTGRKGTIVLESGKKRHAFTVEQIGEAGIMKHFAIGADLEDVEEDEIVDIDDPKVVFKGGARVKNINLGGITHEFGFKEGDIIVEVDGKVTECVADLTMMLNSHQPDEMVNFKIIRDGKTSTRTGLLRAVRKL